MKSKKRKTVEILLYFAGIIVGDIILLKWYSHHDLAEFQKGIIAALIGLLIFWIPALVITLSSPFQFPYYKKTFDVSGKRSPDIEEYIEQFICDNGFSEFENFEQEIIDWKTECEEFVESAFLKSLRKKQYEKCKDEERAFQFYFSRGQTRYVQQNHVKTKYKVDQVVYSKYCSYNWLTNRNSELRAIGYVSTLKKYHCKNQRKLMTRELRESIMKRDRYTCQKCGKYMPDEVGLQIDHIIPVAKGGKSISSNLQVLCSKCNSNKSDKIDD